MTLTSQTRPADPAVGSRPGHRAGTSFWQAVGLVASREIRVRLRDKTFLFSAAFLLLLAGASVIMPALLDDNPTVAVADSGSSEALSRAGLEVRTVPDDETAEQLVRDGEVDAAVVGTGSVDGGSVGNLRVLALTDAPTEVVNALSVAPPVELLDPDAVGSALRFLVPMAFGMIFFLTSITFGVQISQSVTEEKQTRIVEILAATVPPRALLAGKVIAASVLALGQIALIALITVIGLRVTDTGTVLDLLGPAIGWFVPFFVIGFVLLAALWAAAGALVSRVEDIGAVSMPVQMAVMLPFFGVVFLHDNATVMTVLSYVPFSAPSAMPVRLFFGQAAPWEPMLALVLLLAAAVAVVLVGARIYEGSLLRTSGRIKLVEAWRRHDR